MAAFGQEDFALLPEVLVSVMNLDKLHGDD
jgi:hypothetical protein